MGELHRLISFPGNGLGLVEAGIELLEGTAVLAAAVPLLEAC
ncbi:MAG: hypothetical protein OXC05_12010 [Halieaceae bacterium]|nr:hypothetical protein [Halieaceae bacterium]